MIGPLGTTLWTGDVVRDGIYCRGQVGQLHDGSLRVAWLTPFGPREPWAPYVETAILAQAAEDSTIVGELVRSDRLPASIGHEADDHRPRE